MKLLPAPKSIFERFHYGIDFGMKPDRIVISCNIRLTSDEITSVLENRLVRIHDDIYEIPEHYISRLKDILRFRNLGVKMHGFDESILLELIKIAT